MARIVIAVDDRGRRFKVTEEQANKRGLTVLGKTSTSEVKTKTVKKPAAKKKAPRGRSD